MTAQPNINAPGAATPKASKQNERVIRQPDPIMDEAMDQLLPIKHWANQSTIKAYATHLLAAPLGWSIPWEDILGCYPDCWTGTWDELLDRLDDYAATHPRPSLAIPPNWEGMTPAEQRALYAMRQSSTVAPGWFVMPQLTYRSAGKPKPPSITTLNRLARRGLLLHHRRKGNYGRLSGKRKSYGATRNQYIVTDAVVRALSPDLPPLVVEPHLPRPISATLANELRDWLLQHNRFTDGIDVALPLELHTKGSQRVIVAGDHVTYVKYIDQTTDDYTAESFLSDMQAFIRLHIPEAVIDTAILKRSARPMVRPRQLTIADFRDGAYAPRRNRVLAARETHDRVLITFHIAGAPLRLLPAPIPLPPSRANYAAAEDDAPSDEAELTAIWHGLTNAARAALLVIANAPAVDVVPGSGWVPVRGVSPAALKALDDALLIFRVDDLQEAKLTAKGHDMVALARSGAVWTPDDHNYAVAFVAAGSAGGVS